MGMKIAVVGAFMMNLFFGHVCMISMAMAADMPLHHDEGMEMAMTPIEPMSPAHCEHCAHLAKEQPSPMSAGCAGHCLSQSYEGSRAVASNGQTILATIALPPSPPVIVASIDIGQSFADANGPPVGSSLTRTVVFLE